MSVVQSQDVFDFDGYQRRLADLEQSGQKWAESLVSHIKRVTDSLEETKGGLREIADAMRTGTSSKPLEENARQIENLVQRTANYRQQLEQVSQAEKANQVLIQELTTKLDQLNQRYQALDPSAKDYQKQQRAILQETRTVSKAIEVQNGVLKEGKRVVDAAEGSFNALKKQTADLKKQLDTMPNAYDQATGKINQQNRAAVELNKTYQKNIDLIKKVESGQQVYSRNVGNYPKSTPAFSMASVAGLAGGGIGKLAGAGAALAGIDSLFNAIGKIGSVTADFEKFDAVLTNTFNSSKASAEAIDMIQRFAAKTPYSVNELTESFVKLANRGFVPTEKELYKLADLAASTGKPFDQLVEAILDAQTGEFERLKEFGIKAKKSGDDIAFSFKGQTTVVKNTEEALRGYILSLGDLQGVQGATEKISQTLGGQVSNLGDAYDQLALKIGQKLAPLFAVVVSGATSALNKITSLFKNTNDLSKDSLTAYEGQQQAVKNLQATITPLINRYDELSEKARQLGGETKLSKGEQQELQKAITGIADVIPSAISAQNEYGKVMSINTQVARDYITEQERVARVLNAEAINKRNEALALTQQRIQSLTGQLTLLQGATPTKPGEPAVSRPSNTLPGGTTGTALPGLSEKERASQIGRIRQELAAANEEAKDLQATVDYLSGKAPKSQSALPPSVKSSTAPPSQTAQNKALQDALAKAKASNEVELSRLSNDRQDGLISEQDFIEKRLKVTLAGIEERQNLLQKADKKETDDYKKLIKEKLDAETQYSRDKLKLDLSTAKSNTAESVAGLDGQKAKGLIDERTYVEEKHKVVVAGIEQQQRILTESGQQESELYRKLNLDLLKEAADYSEARVKAEEESWKKQLQVVKDGLSEINQQVGEELTAQLTDIEASYTKRQQAIELDVKRGKVSPDEGRQQIHALRLEQLREELKATEDAYQKDRTLSDSLYLDKMQTLLDYKNDAIRTPAEIEAAEKAIADLKKAREKDLADDKKKLDKEVAENAQQANKETFENESENIDKLKEKRQILWDQAFNLANTIGSAVSDITSSNIARQEARLEKQHENELKLAGDNADAKQKIEEQYNKRKAELQRKQAVADRNAALFNIALSTAQGVMAVLSTGGGTRYADFGISAGLLSAFVIAGGLAQAAAVIARPLPEFWTGISSAPEGSAHLAERGPELRKHQDGRYSYYDQPTIDYLDRGDTIYNASQTAAIIADWQKQEAARQALQDMHLNRQATQNLRDGRQTELRLIMAPVMTNNLSESGIGREVARALDGRPVHETHIDQDGFHDFIREGNGRREYLNKRNSFR